MAGRKEISVVGLLPAAGHARRLPGLSGSKEIVPVRLPGDPSPPRPAALHGLRGLARAGARRAYMVLRTGKWDVPAQLGNAGQAGLALAYLVVDPTPGIPHTLDRAYAFVKDHRVALALPDILVDPANAWQALVERQRGTGAAVVLGVLPARGAIEADTVQMDPAGRVRSIAVKDPASAKGRVWCLAVWAPPFTEYLHDLLARPRALADLVSDAREELYPGHVFAAAAHAGLRVDAVYFPEGRFLDIGTPRGLHRATGEGSGRATLP